MAKHQKHEEHVNHERWLVSYADMVTLLFALFVVLYAMGVTELSKLKDLKQSIRWAFHIAGTGKTQDTGIFDQKRGGGDVPVPAPLITAQNGGMREFLHNLLVDFQEVSGNSIQIDQTDDTITIRVPLLKVFEPNSASPVRREVVPWLSKAILGSMAFTSDLRIIIDAHDVPIGMRDRWRVTSMQLCNKRLETLRRFAAQDPSVPSYRVRTEYREPRAVPGEPYRDWEETAQVIFAFSNKRDLGPAEPPR
ncbi:MAG: flagellar motor protein MotB [Planctomycetota bacterium]